MVLCSATTALATPVDALRFLSAEASSFLRRFQHSLYFRFLLAAPTWSLGSGSHQLPLVVLLRLHLAAPPVVVVVTQSAPHHLYLLPSSIFLLPAVGAPIRIAQTRVVFRVDHHQVFPSASGRLQGKLWPRKRSRLLTPPG